MIINLIRIEAIPRKRRELEQTLHSISETTRRLQGCLGHHLYRDLVEENTFCLLQEWQDRVDLDAYLQSDPYHILKGAVGLLSRSQQMTFNVVSRIDATQGDALGVAESEWVRFEPQ
jgi:quinol monooxygenase YgiN